MNGYWHCTIGFATIVEWQATPTEWKAIGEWNHTGLKVNQTSLTLLINGQVEPPSPGLIGISGLDGITELDLSGMDFANINLRPLYEMDDLTDLWLVDTVNLGAADLHALLGNLATIEGTRTEGILHRTRAGFSELVRREPDNPLHYNNRSLAYKFQGDLDRALADLNHCQQRRSPERGRIRSVAPIHRLATVATQESP